MKPSPQFPHTMLTIPEAAAELGIGVKSLRDKIEQGTGPRTIQNGNERLIPRWELQAWQERMMGKDDSTVKALVDGGHRIPPRGLQTRHTQGVRS